MMGFDLRAIFILYKLHYYFYDPRKGRVATNPRRSFRPRKSAGGVEVDPGKCFDGFVFDHFGSSVGLYFFYINYTTIFMTHGRGGGGDESAAIFPSEKVRRRGGGRSWKMF